MSEDFRNGAALTAHVRSLGGPTIHVAAPGEAEFEITRAAATAAGITTHELDGQRARSKAALLDVIAIEMNFSSYFGHNWDALVDCLRDVNGTDKRGVAILIRNTDALLEDETAQAQIRVGSAKRHTGDAPLPTFIEILRRRVEEHRAQHVPMYVLFARSSRIVGATTPFGVCDHASGNTGFRCARDG